MLFRSREPGPTTSLTPQGVVDPSRFSRSGESSAKTTTEAAQEMSNAERKMTLVMRVERPHEGFMLVPCQKRNGPLPKEEWSLPKRGMVPCQKEEWSPAKRGMVPCQKRNGPLPKRCAHFRDLEECMRASRLAASSRRRACATCGLLFLHFLLNLVLWVPRPRPTTKRAANSLRNLIIWVGALAHEGATWVEGILNQKSQV